MLSFPQTVQWVKNLPAMQETWDPSLGCEDNLEEGIVSHFSILAWRNPRTVKPGRIQSMRSQSVREEWSNRACACICSALEPYEHQCYVYKTSVLSSTTRTFCWTEPHKMWLILKHETCTHGFPLEFQLSVVKSVSPESSSSQSHI